jgi:hypothetical protein
VPPDLLDSLSFFNLSEYTDRMLEKFFLVGRHSVG